MSPDDFWRPPELAPYKTYPLANCFNSGEGTWMRNGKRGRYTLEFKLEGVRLVESGQSIAEAARSLGVVEQTLSNWVRAKRAGKLKEGSGQTSGPNEDRPISRSARQARPGTLHQGRRRPLGPKNRLGPNLRHHALLFRVSTDFQEHRVCCVSSKWA